MASNIKSGSSTLCCKVAVHWLAHSFAEVIGSAYPFLKKNHQNITILKSAILDTRFSYLIMIISGKIVKYGQMGICYQVFKCRTAVGIKNPRGK